MSTTESIIKPGPNKQYIIVVSFLTFVLPVAATCIEVFTTKGNTFSFALFGK